MEEFPKLLSPINYGGIILKNRVIFAPTTLGLGKKKYLKFIENLAKGGVALIIIGDVPVSKSKFVPSVYTRSGRKLFKQITSIAHKYNCKIAAQLYETDTNMFKLGKIMPKLMSKKLNEVEKQKLINNVTSAYISNIPTLKVKQITSNFGKTALICKELGFDMIQVHGDRMCGSFSSSLFNKRKDEYGGDITNRSLFAIEAVKSIKKVLPDIPIDFKLVVRLQDPHYGNAGITLDEVKTIAPLLTKSGVTSFHVTLANHSKLEDTIPSFKHPNFANEGCFLNFCDEVRKYTNVLITGVGNLTHPEFIEHELENKRIDCVAMSRQLIADPNYVNKLKNHCKSSIKYCIHCNKGCLQGLMTHRGVTCILNKKKQ